MELPNINLVEVTSKKELIDCLKFRYKVYQESRVKAWTYKGDNAILELDSYDLYARHYAAIEINSFNPVAYMRVVQDRPSTLYNEILEIADDQRLNISKPTAAIPVLEYFPGASQTIAKIISCYTQKSSICEPGRFSIMSEYRKLNFTKSFIEYIFDQDQGRSTHAVVSCVKTHVQFYKRYGFAVMAGTQSIKVNDYLPEVNILVKELCKI